MSLDRQSNILLGVSNGLAAGALWGFVFLAPQLLPNYSSLHLTISRYLVYGALALLLLLPRKHVLLALKKSEWLALIWLSLVGNIVYYLLLAQAVQLVGGAATSLIIGLLPVIVTLVGVKESGLKQLRSLIPPLLLCCLGVGLIASHALQAEGLRSDTQSNLLGLLCAFGALGSWAAYAVGNSHYLKRLNQITSQDWSLMTGVVTGSLAVLLGICLLPFIQTTHSASEWLYFWLISSGIALFASVIGNRFWNQASRLLPLTLTGQMIIFETLFALLYSFLWEQRWPSLLESLAMLCLLLGISWCTAIHRSESEH